MVNGTNYNWSNAFSDYFLLITYLTYLETKKCENLQYWNKILAANPSCLLYNQASLRSYLTECFMSGIMEHFPAKERNAQQPYSQVQY